jgi:putative membrane protein
MRSVFVSLCFALLASLNPATAQVGDPKDLSIGNPGGSVPGAQQQAPGVPAPHQPNQADRTFIIAASLGGAAEVELGKLAEQKSQNGSVKTFAQRMVEDHSAANSQLAKLAEADHVIVDQPDPEHKQMQDGLAGLTGAEFDIEYLRVQVQDHQRAVQLLEYEIGSGEDADAQGLASKLLPTVFMHLEMARDILAQTSAQHPRIAAQPPKATGMPTPQTPRPPKG